MRPRAARARGPSARPPAAPLARFREIFNLVDLDKGGTISKDELKQLMNTLGLKPSQARRTRSTATRRRAAQAAASPCAGGAQPNGRRD